MEEALLLSRKYWLETSSTHWEGSFPFSVALTILAKDHAGYLLTVPNKVHFRTGWSTVTLRWIMRKRGRI